MAGNMGLYRPLIAEVLHTGKPVWFQYQLVPIYRNGGLEDVYWTFSYSPAFGDDGTIEGVLVTCMETTDSVTARNKIEETVAQRTELLAQANASIKKSNSYLQGLINLSKEPMQVLSPVIENGEVVDFRFRLTNIAYAVYANSTPDELADKRVGTVFPGYFETSSFTRAVNTYKTGITETWENHYDKDGLDIFSNPHFLQHRPNRHNPRTVYLHAHFPIPYAVSVLTRIAYNNAAARRCRHPRANHRLPAQH